MTETATSSGRGGTAAAMAQNEQTTEEHSTLEQQSPGRFDHPACMGGATGGWGTLSPHFWDSGGTGGTMKIAPPTFGTRGYRELQ